MAAIKFEEDDQYAVIVPGRGDDSTRGVISVDGPNGAVNVIECAFSMVVMLTEEKLKGYAVGGREGEDIDIIKLFLEKVKKCHDVFRKELDVIIDGDPNGAYSTEKVSVDLTKNKPVIVDPVYLFPDNGKKH